MVLLLHQWRCYISGLSPGAEAYMPAVLSHSGAWDAFCGKRKTMQEGGERIWCLSLKRQMHTALNRSNPTPILAHSFGHFPATGYQVWRGIRHPQPSPLDSGEWVGSFSWMHACQRTCTAVYAQRVEGISVMWMLRRSERRGWDSEMKDKSQGLVRRTS